MRNLTKDELDEYFQFAKADKAAADFPREQAKLVGQAMLDFGLMDMMAKEALRFLESGSLASPSDVLLSILISAFQMGRECESRLLTAALKGRLKK